MVGGAIQREEEQEDMDLDPEEFVFQYFSGLYHLLPVYNTLRLIGYQVVPCQSRTFLLNSAKYLHNQVPELAICKRCSNE